MNTVVFCDALAAAGFLASLCLLYRLRSRVADAQTKLFLGAALGIYLLISGSNVLQYGGITSVFDPYEDYAKGIFVPLFLFGVYSLTAVWELGKRLAAEAELRVSRERYRTLIENVDLGITLIDKDYTVLMTNAAQGRLLQRTPEELVGKKCYNVFRRLPERCRDCPGAVAMRDGRPSTHDRDNVRDNGEPFSIRIHAFPVRNPQGEAEAFIEIVEDRTERKQQEQRRRELEAQLLHAQKLESLGLLAGGIAHDFNNLLMGVLGNADLSMLKLPPDSPVRSYVSRIQAAAVRAAELTSQLVAYSGRSVSEMAPLSLNELVESTAPLLEASVAKKTLLQYRLAAEQPAVNGDATQLRQILMNLILNGSEALGGASGVVTVGTGTSDATRAELKACRLGEELPAGRYVYLEVTDTGSGMDEETRAKVFDPFFTTKFTGRGLGLAAALGIMRNHGGAIRVESAPGAGSSFRLLFPAAERVPLPGAAADQNVPREMARDGWGQRTVLVVDDEETVRTVCKMMLDEFGLSARCASNGREALELFRRASQEVAVVLLDVAMPEMDGFETLQKLREIRPDVPVLLTSGYSEAEVSPRFEGVEVAGFLRKPYGYPDLVNAIRKIVAERAATTDYRL